MKTAACGVFALVLASLPAGALSFSTTTYICDRGIEVPATYVSGEDTDLAVIHIDNRQVTLRAEPAASGVRYSWPTDAPVHVWWTKGDEATLYWKTPEGETPVLTCRIA